VTAVEVVAELMAPTLGWDDADIGRETAAYRDRVQAERRSQDQPTDEMADLERNAAVDLRPSMSSAVMG
jgi:glycerol-3-phosphate dehydrogenase